MSLACQAPTAWELARIGEGYAGTLGQAACEHGCRAGGLDRGGSCWRQSIRPRSYPPLIGSLTHKPALICGTRV